MEHDCIDDVPTLQEVMERNSELEYITNERNLVPSMIEQICTELTGDKSDGDAYRSNILVRKQSVDYLESFGYNLFRQFESEMSCEYFDRPIAKKAEENENATVKFAIVTTLDYALDIRTYDLPRISRMLYTSDVTVDTGSSGYFRESSDAVLPVWGSTKRLPTSLPPGRRLWKKISIEDFSADSDILCSTAGFFTKVVTLRSSLRDRYSTSDFEDLTVDDSETDEGGNSGTPSVPSTQKNGDALTIDPCTSNDTMQYVRKSFAAEMGPKSYGTQKKRKKNATLEFYDARSNENVEYEFSAARGGQMENRNTTTASFSSTQSNDDSSSSDALEVATVVKTECINPGKSSFQSAWTNYNPSTSGSKNSGFLETECRHEQVSRYPLACSNYSEASKADAVWKEDQFDMKRDDCVMCAISFDASQEVSNLSDREHADIEPLNLKNSFLPKNISVKREASSPVSSPRSFRRSQNSKKRRQSQPDLTDANSGMSSILDISMTNNIPFSDADLVYSKSRDSFQEVYVTASNYALETFTEESIYNGRASEEEVGGLSNKDFSGLNIPPKNDYENEYKKLYEAVCDYFKEKSIFHTKLKLHLLSDNINFPIALRENIESNLDEMDDDYDFEVEAHIASNGQNYSVDSNTISIACEIIRNDRNFYNLHKPTLFETIQDLGRHQYIRKDIENLENKRQYCLYLENNIKESSVISHEVSLRPQESIECVNETADSLQPQESLEYLEGPLSFKSQELLECASLQSEVTESVQPQEIVQNVHRRREHSESFPPEESTENAQRQMEDLGRLKRHKSPECEQDGRGSSEWQDSEHSELSTTGLRNSEVRSIPITNDDQVTGADITKTSLVWNRKYSDSNCRLALKLDHPVLYRQEYNRIKQSSLSVFDCLMGRQTHGPLDQRKVLEVVARPHYNIFPPADEEDIERCRQAIRSDEGLSLEGYLLLSLESIRTFDSYPLSSFE